VRCPDPAGISKRVQETIRRRVAPCRRNPHPAPEEKTTNHVQRVIDQHLFSPDARTLPFGREYRIAFVFSGRNHDRHQCSTGHPRVDHRRPVVLPDQLPHGVTIGHITLSYGDSDSGVLLGKVAE